MADTVLKSIVLRNWATVRSAAIEFPEQGLVLVRGINRAAKGKMASIGSGKTALGEAISRALFGVRGRFTQLGHYSSDEQGNMRVEVNCEHKNKPLKVEMGFKAEEMSPTGEALKFTYSSEVQRSLISETRSDLAKILTVPTELADWTIHLDGDALKFADLSEQKYVNLLMDALMQPRYTVYAKKANDMASDYKKDITRERADVESTKSKVAQIDVQLHSARQNLEQAKNVYAAELKALKESAKTLDAEIKQLSEAVSQRDTRMKELRKEIDRRIQVNAKAEHDQEIIVREKREALDTAKDQQRDLKSTETTAARELERAEVALEQARKTPKNCPTCGKAWDKGAKAIEEKQAAVEAARLALDKAESAVSAKATVVGKAQTAVQQAEQKFQTIRAKNSIDELSEEYQGLETALTEDRTNLEAAQQEKQALGTGPDKTEIARFETQVSEREKQLEEASKAVEDLAQRVAEDEEMLRVIEYWQKAFSPYGIPNMVLRDALGPLNAVAKRVSSMMTGGTIDISYATSRTLQKGGEKAELVIKVKNELGSGRVDGSSKGEGGLVNLIVAETLAEVGGIANRIGYRWYDEVGMNQDEVVRRSLFSYFADVARRYGILVFVVSHAPEAASYADYTLVAEKTLQGNVAHTTYRWD